MHTAVRILFTFAITAAFPVTAAFAQNTAPPAPLPAAENQPSKDTTAAQKPREQATALKEFEADMKEIKKWMDAETAKDKTSVTRVLKLVPELVKKFSALRTDGLPEELSGGLEKMTKSFSKAVVIFKDAPTHEEDEFKIWLNKKMASAEFVAEMEAISKEGQRVGDELQAAGLKFGIDLGLDKKRKKSAEEKPGKDEAAAKEKTPGATPADK